MTPTQKTILATIDQYILECMQQARKWVPVDATTSKDYLRLIEIAREKREDLILSFKQEEEKSQPYQQNGKE